MIRLYHWLAIWLCWGVLALHLQAQVPPEGVSKNTGSKPPPPLGVMDESNFFNKDSGALNRISEKLRKLERDHGYKIYLFVEPVLLSTTPSELAAQLRQAWVPDGNGLVLVFESDSRQLRIGLDLENHPNPPENLTWIPSHITSAILARAMKAADSKLAPEPYLEALVGSLTSEYEGYFERRATPPPAERSMKIGLLVIGILALLGLAAITLGALARHSSMTAIHSFRFPAVDQPERLGASCGGSVTTRRFAPPASKA